MWSNLEYSFEFASLKHIIKYDYIIIRYFLSWSEDSWSSCWKSKLLWDDQVSQVATYRQIWLSAGNWPEVRMTNGKIYLASWYAGATHPATFSAFAVPNDHLLVRVVREIISRTGFFFFFNPTLLIFLSGLIYTKVGVIFFFTHFLHP